MAVGSAVHIASSVTMGISIAVLVFEGLVYNAVFLGRVLPALGKSALVIPFGLVFNVVWILAVWSYLQAHWTDPGFVPMRWHEFVKQVGDDLLVVPAQPAWQPGMATYCRKCELPRPERAKHCKICDTCVLRMDHHCPWINNCVGFNNHKFFLLLGTYSGLAGVIAVGTSLPELLLCSAMFVYMEEGMSLAWATEDVNLDVTDITAFLLFGVVAFLAVALCIPLLSMHLPLAMQNITSIEDNYTNMPNPFDKGGTRANLAQIFGVFGTDWFLPIWPKRPLTDGVSFERCDDPFSCNDPFYACTTNLRPEQIWRQRFNVNSKNIVSAEDPDKATLSILTSWMKW